MSKKVPLVIYDKDGIRTVIGEAEVDVAGPHIKVQAKVSKEYEGLVSYNPQQFTISSMRDKHGEDRIQVEGRIPNG